MGQLVYDVCADSRLLRNVASGYFDRNGVHPRSDLGEFGTLIWWSRLRESGKAIVKDGVVSEIVATGHGGNFPEFVFEDGHVRVQFERKGIESLYQAGARIRIAYAKESDLFSYDSSSPYKSLANSHFLLRVETLDT